MLTIAFFSPLFEGLLALDILLLAATLTFVLRLLRRARVDRLDDLDDEDEYDRPDTRLYPFNDRNARFDSLANAGADEISLLPEAQQIIAPSPQPWPDEVLAPKTIPTPEATPPPQQQALYFREEGALSDLYADPIDGTPFTAGEEIWVCRCGIGYHRESWEWLRGNLAGKCVHCGGAGIAEPRRIQPRTEKPSEIFPT